MLLQSQLHDVIDFIRVGLAGDALPQVHTWIAGSGEVPDRSVLSRILPVPIAADR